jgi:glycosyltransferase involved in cell wall biosynthesis
LGIPGDAFVLCLARRAVPEKGWYTAIEAADAVRRISDVDLHLLLLGEGPVYEELGHGDLPAHIHMPGFVDNTIACYAMADVGLLPSTFKGESFPLTVIECLMAGKPVIASDIGEIRTMITNEAGEPAGLLIDVASGVIDVVWLVQGIIALATDHEAYDRKANIAKEIVPKFEMEAVLAQYLEVYSKTRQ